MGAPCFLDFMEVCVDIQFSWRQGDIIFHSTLHHSKTLHFTHMITQQAKQHENKSHTSLSESPWLWLL